MEAASETALRLFVIPLANDKANNFPFPTAEVVISYVTNAFLAVSSIESTALLIFLYAAASVKDVVKLSTPILPKVFMQSLKPSILPDFIVEAFSHTATNSSIALTTTAICSAFTVDTVDAKLAISFPNPGSPQEHSVIELDPNNLSIHPPLLGIFDNAENSSVIAGTILVIFVVMEESFTLSLNDFNDAPKLPKFLLR